MILGRRKMVAACAAVAIVASGAMWAPASAQLPTPTQCVNVPSGTPGTTTTIAGQEVSVPAISNIRLCAGGATIPTVRVEEGGPGCEIACLSVYVGGGALSAGTVTVSWVETVKNVRTPREETVSPDEVELPGGETCVLSTGAPLVANPDCLVAVGIVPPPDDVGPLVDEAVTIVEETISTVMALVDSTCDSVPNQYDEDTSTEVALCDNAASWGVETAEDWEQATCDAVPDEHDPSTGQTYDACANPAEWATAFARRVVGAPCEDIPDRTDPDTGQTYDFCTDPIGWGNSVYEQVRDLGCAAVPDQTDPQTGQTYDFCDEPIEWAGVVIGQVGAMTCAAIPDRTDPDTGQTYDFCTDPLGWALSATRDVVGFTCESVPDWTNPSTGTTHDFCTDPAGWSGAVVQYATNTTCDAFPPVSDESGNTYRFCENPDLWLNEALNDGEQLCNSVVPYAYDYETNEQVWACTEPGRWTAVMIENWCGDPCDLPPINRLLHEIIVYLSEQEIKIIWDRL